MFLKCFQNEFNVVNMYIQYTVEDNINRNYYETWKIMNFPFNQILPLFDILIYK